MEKKKRLRKGANGSLLSELLILLQAKKRMKRPNNSIKRDGFRMEKWNGERERTLLVSQLSLNILNILQSEALRYKLILGLSQLNVCFSGFKGTNE